MTGGDRRVSRVAGDVAELEELHTVVDAAYRADDPDFPSSRLPELVVAATRPPPSRHLELWLLRVDDVPVAGAIANLPDLDNLDQAEVQLGVHPDHQHHGHGRFLLDTVLGDLQKQGRTRILADIGEPPGRGAPYRGRDLAVAAGAVPSLEEVRRTLRLDNLDEAALASLRTAAAPCAAGYELDGWTGRTPDHLAESYAGLAGRMSTDAPQGDRDTEPEVWDIARVRTRDDFLEAQGRLPVCTVARHVARGELVGFTDIGTTLHDVETAFQWDTIVHPDHRGHRLGVLMKLANLDRVRAVAPQTRRIYTWNADVNTHMNAINDAMGFVPTRRVVTWRLDLEGAKDRV
jgi:GNAT superfamily N-acetyltransferase